MRINVETDADAEKYLVSANASRSDLSIDRFKGWKCIDRSFFNSACFRRWLYSKKQAKEMYDVLIIGAGFCGACSFGIYGSCEGLKTLPLRVAIPGGASEQQCTH